MENFYSVYAEDIQSQLWQFSLMSLSAYQFLFLQKFVDEMWTIEDDEEKWK